MNTDYKVLNAVGTVLFTSNDKEIAKAKCRELSEKFLGVRVDAVERIEVRRRIYSPRLRLVEAA